MSDKCKKMLGGCNAWTRPHQCYNNVKKDGYCGIHHPDAVKARQEKTNKRWKEKLDNSDYGKLKKALATIATLTEQVRAQDKWISVDEGFPLGFHQECLVWRSGDNKNFHAAVDYLIDEETFSELYYVTHWMPLPTPPKEAE